MSAGARQLPIRHPPAGDLENLETTLQSCGYCEHNALYTYPSSGVPHIGENEGFFILTHSNTLICIQQKTVGNLSTTGPVKKWSQITAKVKLLNKYLVQHHWSAAELSLSKQVTNCKAYLNRLVVFQILFVAFHVQFSQPTANFKVL